MGNKQEVTDSGWTTPRSLRRGISLDQTPALGTNSIRPDRNTEWNQSLSPRNPYFSAKIRYHRVFYQVCAGSL